MRQVVQVSTMCLAYGDSQNMKWKCGKIANGFNANAIEFFLRDGPNTP